MSSVVVRIDAWRVNNGGKERRNYKTRQKKCVFKFRVYIFELGNSNFMSNGEE